MAQTIKIKRSSTSGNKLTSSNSVAGELGLNTADKALYIQTGSTNGDVVTVAHESTLKIDESNGRIGINTTSPDTRLDIDGLVNGGIAFTSTQVEIDRQSLLPNGRIFYNDSRLIYDSPANGHRFAVAGNQGSNIAMVIDSNQKVGIGTTAPTELLYVQGTNGAIVIDAAGASNTASLKFINDNERSRITSNYGSGGGGQLGFWTDSTGGTLVQRMTITNAGNVGIGTTSPSSKLHLADTSNDIELRFEPQSQANYPKLVGGSAAGTNDTYFAVDFVTRGEALRVDGETGNVGIGTTSPAAKLHISGNSDLGDADCMLIIDDVDGSVGSRVPAIMFRSNTGGTVTNQARIRGHDLYGMVLSGSSALGNDLVVQAGKIGIGTNSPEGIMHFSSSSDYDIVFDHTAQEKFRLRHGTSGIYLTGPDTNTLAFGVDQSHDVRMFNTSGSAYATFDGSTSRVGIGTTSPGTKLHISDSATPVLRISHTAGIAQNVDIYNSGGTMYLRARNDTANGPIIFQGGGGGTNTEYARFQSTGYLGVGTTGPARRLHVKDTNYSVARLERDGAGGGVALEFRNGDGNIWQVSNDGDEVLRFYYATNNRFQVTSTGAATFNNAFTFPTSDGSANQVLKTDGSGNVTWATEAAVSASTSISDADGDTKIQTEESADEDVIRFDTAGSQRMLITSGGNVGINNASPAKTLVVGGTFQATGEAFFSHFDNITSSSRMRDDLRLNFGTARTFAIAGNSTNMHMKNGTTDVMTFDTSNRVGIGTTAPSYLLHVDATVSTDPSYIVASSATNFVVAMGSQNSPGVGQEAFVGTLSNDDLKIKSNNTERIRVKADGKVGIGNSSPSAKLTIHDNSSYSGALFRVDGQYNDVIFNGGSVGTDGVWEFKNVGTWAQTRFYVQDANNADDRLTFDFRGSGTTNKILAGTSSGKVGIGTTTPSSLLHLKDTGDAVLIVEADSDNSTETDNARIELRQDGNNVAGYFYTEGNAGQTATGTIANTTVLESKGGGNDVGIHFATGGRAPAQVGGELAGTVRMTVHGSGGVTIGTTSTTNNGGLLVDNDIKTNSRLGIGSPGNVSTPALYNNSDTDTGVYWPAANTLGLVTASTERLRITSTGLVGIGNGATTPTEKLHIFDNVNNSAVLTTTGTATRGGIIKVENDNTTVGSFAALDLRTGSGDARIAAVKAASGDNSADLAFIVDDQSAGVGVERLRIEGETGYIGIGTNSPNVELDLRGNMRLDGSAGTDRQIYFRNQGTGGGSVRSDKNLSLWAGNGSGSLVQYVTIEEGGRVGIGTTDPVKYLHLQYSSSATAVSTGDGLSGAGDGGGALIQNTNTSGNTFANLDFRARDADGRIAYQYAGATNNGDFHFITDNIGSPHSQLIIRNNGKVEFNQQHTSLSSTANGATLAEFKNYVGSDLNQQKSFLDFIFSDDNGNETPQVRIGAEVGRNGDANTQVKEGSGAFVVYTNNADTISGDAGASLAERFRVDYAGNVGIGTATPAARLEIKGTTTDNSAEALNVRDSSNNQLFRVRNDGVVIIGDNYLYVTSSAGAYFDGTVRFRNGITDDTGQLSLNSSTGDITFNSCDLESVGNITTSGYLRGPSTFTIDPATHADNTGTVVIAGNLQVDGTTTTINSTTLTVDDKNITLASGSTNAAAANGAGITVDCGSDTDATFTYDGTNDEWDFNKNINVTGGVVSSANGAITTASGTTARFQVSETGGATTAMDARGSTGNIGTRSNHTLGFLVNDVQKATLTAGGDFTVTNDIKVTTTNPRIDYDGGNSGALRFYSTSAAQERMRITSAGNVGIGTTSPTDTLEISKQLSAAQTVDFPFVVSSRDDGNSINQLGGEGVGIKFRLANNASTTPGGSFVGAGIAAIRENTADDNSSTSLAFYTSQNDETLDRYMTIRSSGNVGIGTTSPGQKLDVRGNVVVGSEGASDYNRLYFKRAGGASVGAIGWHSDNIFYIGGHPNYGPTAGNDVRVYGFGSDIHIGDNSNGDVITVQYTSGNVGIGTASPNAKLQVEELGIDTTTTTTSATTQVAIDTMAAATFRSAEFTIQVTNSTDSTYHLTKVLLIHDGTTPGITEYGTVFTGSAAEATFDADILSGNVRLLATPATIDSMTFKVVRHCITV